MLKITRPAVLAAVLLVAIAATVAPRATQAQAQPAAPAMQAAPAAPAAAPESTAPPVAKAPSAKATEVIENPYGLEALWRGGGIVAKITLAILGSMSAGSWYIIVTKVYEQYKMGKHARAADKTF